MTICTLLCGSSSSLVTATWKKNDRKKKKNNNFQSRRWENGRHKRERKKKSEYFADFTASLPISQSYTSKRMSMCLYLYICNRYPLLERWISRFISAPISPSFNCAVPLFLLFTHTHKLIRDRAVLYVLPFLYIMSIAGSR